MLDSKHKLLTVNCKLLNDFGFTLIELLIVISIIGILSAIGLVLYSSVLKQGRDSKRQSDLKSIQLALEQYNNDQGYYPTCIGNGNSTDCITQLDKSVRFDNSAGKSTPPPSSKVYLENTPVDPLNKYINPSWYIYYYQTIPDTCDNTAGKYCTRYCLYNYSENTNSIGWGGCSGSGNYGVWFNYALAPP